jgi:hypothetical protein
MMASRGMGAINPSKMPGKKEITRTDDPNKVAMYKKGGKVKKYSGEEGSEVKEEPLNFNLQPAKDDGLSVKPTHAVIDKNYKRVGANISGDIPLDDQSKLNVSADLAAVRARGQGTKAALDRVKAEYTRNLDKDTTFGASMSKSPLDKRFMVALNKTFKNGGSAKQAATAIAMKAAGKKPKKMAAGGELKEVPEDNVGLSKLPAEVRNKMGYMKEGGGVNAAGNYTKPELRKRIVSQVKAAATQGTGAGQWSARKAQLVAKKYKAAGGGYRD